MSSSTSPVFDVAVLGAGPAGAAAALEATRRGRTVILFERGDERADKPCGEGVMPSGVETLRALGLDAAVRAGRPFPGIRHRVAGAGPLSIDLDAPGVAIRRPVLAAALDAALGDARGLVRLRASASGRPRPDGSDGGAFEIDAGPAGHFFARTLIACDGSGGRGAAWLQGVRRRGRPSQRFGVRARCRTGAPLDRVEVHMGRGCELYLTPLPDDLVNVALLVERAPEGVAGAVALLAWGLARHPEAQAHLGAIVTPPGARALDARRPRRASEAGAFLAGDAAGAVDPIVGLRRHDRAAHRRGRGPRGRRAARGRECGRRRPRLCGDGPPRAGGTPRAGEPAAAGGRAPAPRSVVRRGAASGAPRGSYPGADRGGEVTEPLLGDLLLGAIALHRGLELVWARANLRRLVARGGVVVQGRRLHRASSSSTGRGSCACSSSAGCSARG